MVLIVVGAIPLLFGILPQLMGMDTYEISSGSMEPSYPVGSIVYIDPLSSSVEAQYLQDGDVIAFYSASSGDMTVHRIIENDQTVQELITKGDANAEADLLPIPYENVVGKAILTLPRGLSGLFDAMQSMPGRFVLAALLICGVLLLVMSGSRGKRAAAA